MDTTEHSIRLECTFSVIQTTKPSSVLVIARISREWSPPLLEIQAFNFDHEGYFFKKDINIHEYTYVVKVTANGKVETKLTRCVRGER